MLKPGTKFAVVRQSRPAMLPPAGQFCNYTPRVCMRARVDGYDYCIRHILEDKNSPYKQCTYVSGKTNRRCALAAPRIEKRAGFCPEHARKAVLSRHRMMAKPRRSKNLNSLLDDLSHHTTKPVTDCDGRQKPNQKTASHSMEFASGESDSERDLPTVGEIWKTDEESDMESIDSEQEDPLKHAGVYTAEEVASILRDKLIRLQSLYIDQFRYLHHLLREKRRKYLHGLQQLGRIPGSESRESSITTHAEKTAREKLLALRRYQRHYGKEALLHRQCKQRRIAFSEGKNYIPPVFPECNSIKEDGVKCTARTLPLSKRCIDHIMLDTRQVLFKQCNHGDTCRRSVVTFDDAAECNLHQQLQPVVRRYMKKQEEVDMKDEPVDVVGLADVQVDLCQDFSCDLAGESLLGDTKGFLDKKRVSQKPA